MHEIGLCEGLMEAVERRAAGRPLDAVRVRVGALHRVVDASMETAFSMVSAGTVADGAHLDLVVVPVAVHCRACGLDESSSDPLAVCSRCGSTDLDLDGGDELVLESITVRPTEGAAHVPGHPG